MNIEQKKDDLKTELIKLNYFKTQDGRQLYELEIDELKEIYENEKAKASQNYEMEIN